MNALENVESTAHVKNASIEQLAQMLVVTALFSVRRLTRGIAMSMTGNNRFHFSQTYQVTIRESPVISPTYPQAHLSSFEAG